MSSTYNAVAILLGARLAGLKFALLPHPARTMDVLQYRSQIENMFKISSVPHNKDRVSYLRQNLSP